MVPAEMGQVTRHHEGLGSIPFASPPLPMPLSVTGQGLRQLLYAPGVNSRAARMVALHATSNVLLETNRLWQRDGHRPVINRGDDFKVS
jgi:hypothetical protein